MRAAGREEEGKGAPNVYGLALQLVQFGDHVAHQLSQFEPKDCTDAVLDAPLGVVKADLSLAQPPVDLVAHVDRGRQRILGLARRGPGAFDR
jgi:hypothetical protein